MPRVNMVLTDTDAKNADYIEEEANARSKAHAVGIALAVTRYVVDALREGAQLQFVYPNGAAERVVFPDLAGVGRKRSPA